MAHKHPIYDTDPHFTINPTTRKIENQTEGKTKLMQYDHNSERFTFCIPRLIDGHDMSKCDKVEIHYINLSTNGTQQNADVYPVDDVTATEETEEVFFSWLISQNATQIVGTLNFIIKFICLDGEEITYLWNTDIFKGMHISSGINNAESVVTENSDVLEAWKSEVLADVLPAVEEAKAADSSAWVSAKSAEASARSASELVMSATQAAGRASQEADRAEAAAERAEAASPEIVQTTGDSETAVMSQKAVTDFAKLTIGAIDEIYSPSIPDTCPYGGYISSTGGFVLSGSWVATEFITINKSAVIFTAGVYGAATISTVAFYDNNKSFISSICGSGNVFNINATPPENAKYVRFTFLAARKNDKINLIQWNEAITNDNIAQESGSAEDKIMSQKAITEYIPKIPSRNIANLKFEHAYINANGFFKAEDTQPECAAPEYIPVKGDTSYTFSCDTTTLDISPTLVVSMYDENKSHIGASYWNINDLKGTSIKTAQNCGYIRISVTTTDTGVDWTNNWQKLIPSRLQIEFGEKTDYIAPMIIAPDLIDKSAETKFDYSAYGLPILEFEGDIVGISKDNAVTLSYKYGDRNGSCTLKWQGSSSLTYPKKNYTVKFDTAFEAKEGWGEQKKYCLKANYIDFSHSRNICSAKLWGSVVKSRTSASEKIKSLPNCGAIDGFPICVVINGKYQGLYTFNIPKDGWMFGMGDGTNEAVLCANGHDATSVSVATFKAEVTTMDENDGLEMEYVSDENKTDWVKTSLNRLITACINSDGTDLDTTIAQYLDWDSAIDYYIFCLLTQNIDGVSKNYLLATYDGVKWFFSAYDLDSTFGLYVTGKRFMPNDGGGDGYGSMRVSNAGGHRVFELIAKYKSAELKARYKKLIEGYTAESSFENPLSENRIVDTFYNFIGTIPKAILDEEVKMWTGLPSTSTNNVSQIIDHYRRRRAFIDPQIEAL